MTERGKDARPLFLVGTGRCGSTVLHHMLSEHPELAFLSRVLSRFPARLGLQRQALRLWDSGLLPKRIRERIGPTEGWPFWDHHVPGFSAPYRDMLADDVSAKVSAAVPELLDQLRSGSRQRVLIKFTGWTRLGFIKTVFPNAKIVHIVRDPHPVVHSMLNVSWWHGWGGPEQWRWGPLTEREQRVWREHDESFLVLAGIEWIKIMRAYRDSLERLSPEMRTDVLEIHYDELCAAKDETIQRILEFSALGDSKRFVRALKPFSLRSQDTKWQRNFTAAQQEVLQHALDELDWRLLLPS